jgi:hypothetical protein
MAKIKADADSVAREAIKLGVREDHARAATGKGVKDESFEAFKAFVGALEEGRDKR